MRRFYVLGAALFLVAAAQEVEEKSFTIKVTVDGMT